MLITNLMSLSIIMTIVVVCHFTWKLCLLCVCVCLFVRMYSISCIVEILYLLVSDVKKAHQQCMYNTLVTAILEGCSVKLTVILLCM